MVKQPPTQPRSDNTWETPFAEPSLATRIGRERCHLILWTSTTPTFLSQRVVSVRQMFLLQISDCIGLGFWREFALTSASFRPTAPWRGQSAAQLCCCTFPSFLVPLVQNENLYGGPKFDPDIQCNSCNFASIARNNGVQ